MPWANNFHTIIKDKNTDRGRDKIITVNERIDDKFFQCNGRNLRLS